MHAGILPWLLQLEQWHSISVWRLGFLSENRPGAQPSTVCPLCACWMPSCVCSACMYMIGAPDRNARRVHPHPSNITIPAPDVFSCSSSHLCRWASIMKLTPPPPPSFSRRVLESGVAVESVKLRLRLCHLSGIARKAFACRWSTRRGVASTVVSELRFE